MSNDTNQARQDDAVLGGQTPPPLQGAILGGIEGVKSRLASARVEARLSALSDAVNYGDAGLSLIIESLEDSCRQVRHSAYRLLEQRSEPRAIQARRDYKFWDGFHSLFGYVCIYANEYAYADGHTTEFANRKVVEFDSKTIITDPAGTAYAIRSEERESRKVGKGEIDTTTYALMKKLQNTSWDWREWNTKDIPDNIIYRLAKLLQDPQVRNLEALVCGYYNYFDLGYNNPRNFIDVIVAVSDRLPNLKALFLGDIPDRERMMSYIYHGDDISPILAVYPHLEVLKIRTGSGSSLAFSPWWHDRLKALIVETVGLGRQAIADICALGLPSLEYLELWLGNLRYGGNSSVEDLMPILSGEVFPKLKYLGLRNSEYSDEIALAIVESLIINNLFELDLSLGTLVEEGAEALLDCPAVNELYILNVANNCLKDNSNNSNILERLSGLDCRVVADRQKSARYYRYCSVAE